MESRINREASTMIPSTEISNHTLRAFDSNSIPNCQSLVIHTQSLPTSDTRSDSDAEIRRTQETPRPHIRPLSYLGHQTYFYTSAKAATYVSRIFVEVSPETHRRWLGIACLWNLAIRLRPERAVQAAYESLRSKLQEWTLCRERKDQR